VGVGDRRDGERERSWTVLAALTWTAQRFEQAKIPSARLDAELLLCAATGLDRVGLYVGHDRPLDETERSRYRDLVRRRLEGEPVAYLVGEQEFWSLPLTVDPRVLIPRRETEHVVEQVLRVFPEGTLVDVGTGSGAIALAVKKERPAARVIAIDASADALAVARANAARLGLEVEFREGDLLTPVDAPVDVIASNPPYVRSEEIPRLQREVQREPRRALDGGPDGLDVIRRLIPAAREKLRPGGFLVMEIGSDQGAATLELLKGWSEPRIVQDLAKLDRVAVARAVSPS
jgi:release factor glutamine methyltransferase